MALSKRVQAPFLLPVFDAVVWKHMPITRLSHCHNFRSSRTASPASSRTASPAACPEPEANFGTPRSLVFQSMREEIRTDLSSPVKKIVDTLR